MGKFVVCRHKNSAQMARALVIVLTQAWISRQDVLFKPFSQLPKLSQHSLEQEGKVSLSSNKLTLTEGNFRFFLSFQW